MSNGSLLYDRCVKLEFNSMMYVYEKWFLVDNLVYLKPISLNIIFHVMFFDIAIR